MLEKIVYFVRNGLDKKKKVSIGKYTYGNPRIISHCGSNSKLQIGKFCSISSNVTILLNAEHRTDWVTTFPFPSFNSPFSSLSRKWKNAKNILGHPTSRGDITIGNDVWIGYGATILSGVKIGDGAVIGASSLVTKDVEPYTIVGGNPARPLRKRFDDEKIRALLRIRWWDWPDEKINENISLLCSSKIDSLIKLHDKK